jgi:hypothetical protein
MLWGIPYFLGRQYFTNARALKDLALGVVLAATMYAPLCLLEVRLSAQLSNWVYGPPEIDFLSVRYGGYQPRVFFGNGLALGTWMVTATLIAAWLWWSERDTATADKTVRTDTWLGWCLVILVPTAVLTKSTGALALGLAGWGVICMSKMLRSKMCFILLMSVPPAYVAVRTTGAWTGASLVEVAQATAGEDRAQSLEFRLQCEELLIKRALERPVFGWGGWGRSRVHDDTGKDIAPTDGLWIIALGSSGFVGLIALGGFLLLPALRFAFFVPPSSWSDRLVAPAAACAVALVLWSIDSLLNAMFNPVFPLISGSLVGLNLAVNREKTSTLTHAQCQLVPRGTRDPRPALMSRSPAGHS